MKTEGRRQSENVEDRRSQGGGRFPGGRVGMGGGVGLIAVVVIALFLGVDPTQLLSGLQDTTVQGPSGAPYEETPEEAKRSAFVRVVLADTEDVWTNVFAQAGQTYQLPTLVLFRGAVQSACGFAQSAVGPVLLSDRSEGLSRPVVL